MSNSKKQRLLIMNGQRLVQTEQGGNWATQKVDKAGALKPGIYDLYLANGADKSKSHDGPVLYSDKDSVYQKVGKSYVRHERQDFTTVPESGVDMKISYEDGLAIVVASSAKLGRGFSR
jgi:hypothetical protein